MDYVYKGAKLIKDMYNQINPATLTGAIDVLVIEQEDKELCASPFHVRFGKLGVMTAKEKLVNISINDEDIDLHMKLGDQGEAFFVVETDDEEIPARLLTSPLPSRPVSPCVEGPTDLNRSVSKDEVTTVKRKRRKRRKRRSISSPTNDLGQEVSQSSDSEDEVLAQVNTSLSSMETNHSPRQMHPPEPQLSIDMPADEDEPIAPYNRLCSVFSDSELPSKDKEIFSLGPDSPYSDSEAIERKEIGTPVAWDWGELPNGEGSKRRLQTLSLPDAVRSELTLENETKSYPSTRMAAKSDYSQPAGPEIILEKTAAELSDASESVVEEPPEILKTPPPTPSKEGSNDSVQPISSREGSPKKKARRPAEGLYLDEILDLEPSEANLYLSSKQVDKASDMQDSSLIDNVRSRTPEALFPDAGVDSGTDCVVSEDATEFVELNLAPMKISLCGGRLESGKLVVDEEKFQEKELSYEQFMEDPVGITKNPDLVIYMGNRYCDWETAGPLFLSVCIYRKPLTNDVVDRLIDKQVSKKTRAATGGRLSWFWRRGSQRDSSGSAHSDQGSGKDKEASDAASTPVAKATPAKSYSAAPNVNNTGQKSHTDESSSCEDEIAALATGRKELKRAQTVPELKHLNSQSKTLKKTTRLTSDQLKSLNLKPGANEVKFSVTTQYQGTSRCFANIYLWKHSDKLVVSDIDGTITKSDVFGQILPVVGKDWTQGGVAQLYDNISKNGYKFIYLSARAIGQSKMTKVYLNWINQQGVSLPPGPLFLSPTSLIRAFRTEVIEKKPERFKIQCLKDIKALFPNDSQPLVAGFGNKVNDVVAYNAVGIPNRRVFTINPKGELKQEDLQMYTTSYGQLGDVVDTFFPALDSKQCSNFSDTQEYSTFNYWRTDVPDVAEDLKF